MHIIDLLLLILKKLTVKLLKYKTVYERNIETEKYVKKESKFDLRKVPEKLKKLILHDQKIIDERWSHCEGCEHLIKATNTCKKCGCFMKVKTKVATASCPVGKWDKVYNLSGT